MTKYYLSVSMDSGMLAKLAASMAAAELTLPEAAVAEAAAAAGTGRPGGVVGLGPCKPSWLLPIVLLLDAARRGSESSLSSLRSLE